MRRFLARSVAILCVLLVVTCLMVWFRSWWVEDGKTFAYVNGNHYTVYSVAGAVRLSVIDANVWTPQRHSTEWWSRPASASSATDYLARSWYRLGFIVDRGTFSPNSGKSWVPLRKPTAYGIYAVPHWFFTAIFSLPLTLPLARRAWRRRRARRRAAEGLCTGCGYDLRGGHSGRCPECGLAKPFRQPPPLPHPA